MRDEIIDDFIKKKEDRNSHSALLNKKEKIWKDSLPNKIFRADLNFSFSILFIGLILAFITFLGYKNNINPDIVFITSILGFFLNGAIAISKNNLIFFFNIFLSMLILLLFPLASDSLGISYNTTEFISCSSSFVLLIISLTVNIVLTFIFNLSKFKKKVDKNEKDYLDETKKFINKESIYIDSKSKLLSNKEAVLEIIENPEYKEIKALLENDIKELADKLEEETKKENEDKRLRQIFSGTENVLEIENR